MLKQAQLISQAQALHATLHVTETELKEKIGILETQESTVTNLSLTSMLPEGSMILPPTLALHTHTLHDTLAHMTSREFVTGAELQHLFCENEKFFFKKSIFSLIFTSDIF